MKNAQHAIKVNAEAVRDVLVVAEPVDTSFKMHDIGPRGQPNRNPFVIGAPNGPEFVALITYPGSTQVHLMSGPQKYVAATEENLPSLYEVIDRLLAENIISTAQVFRAAGPVVVRKGQSNG